MLSILTRISLLALVFVLYSAFLISADSASSNKAKHPSFLACPPSLPPVNPYLVVSSRAQEHSRLSSRKGSSSSRNSAMMAQTSISTPGAHSLTLVNSKTGNKVAGILHIKDPTSSSLCVICHGLCSSKETGIVRTVGEELDFNTYRFDFTGNGDSEGDFRYTGYDQEVEDLRAVVEGLRSRGWNIACIFGHSKGAHAVLRYTSIYGDVSKVFSLAARFDFSQQPSSRFTSEQLQAMEEDGFFLWSVRGREYKITKEDFQERDRVDMVSLLERVKTTPHPSVSPFLLLAHGEADETIPVKDVDAIAAILGPRFCRVVRFPGADHFYRRREGAQAVVEAASRFLKE